MAAKLNVSARSTLSAVFADPVRANIAWKDIEALFVALGADVVERRGSRVGILLNDRIAVFHRPHPAKETDKGAVRAVRRLLENAGIRP